MILLIKPFISLSQENDTTYHSKLLDTLRMNEVTISAKSAISTKGDTVSYRVDSFNKDPLANTEDVLKKLPGIDVDADGKITVNGKPVNKIFINGKEFQVEDLTTITQNLPANVIEKIKVADYHSEEEVFSGVKKGSEEKVVNLKLKKEYSSGVVGRVSAGYGTKDRYQGGAFLNYMSPNGNRTTLLGAASNTGITRVSNTDDSDNSWRSPGVRKGQRGSVNFTLGNTDKWDMQGTYSYSGGATYLERDKARTTYLQTDSVLLQDENQVQNNNNDRHYLNVRSVAKFNENTRLNTKLQVTYNKSKNDNSIEDITYGVNRDIIDFKRSSSDESTSENGRLFLRNSFMKRLGKPRRVLNVSSTLSYNTGSTNGSRANYNTYYNPFSENAVFNKSVKENAAFNSQLGVKYNEPIGEYLVVSASYDNVYDKSNADSRISVLSGDVYEIDTNQTRIFDNTNIEHRGGLDIQFDNDEMRSGLGVDIVYYNRTNEEQTGAANNVTQNGVNYAPNAFMKYNLSKTKSLQLNYNGNVQAPNIRQLQPIPDYTDSLNIFIGNPNLKPQVRNNVRARFVHRDLKGTNFWAGLSVNWEANKIINKTELTNSKRITTLENANGNYNITGSFSLTEPVIRNKLKIVAATYSRLGNRVVILNNTLNNLQTYNFSPRLRLSYSKDQSVELNLTCTYNWSEVASVSGSKNVLRRYKFSHDGYIKLPLNFRWSYDVSYTYNNGINSDFEQSFLLVSSSIDKSFEKWRSLTLRLQVFDAFNNYPVVSRTVQDSYFEDVSVNRLGRYLMFSVIYKFTKFPKGA